MVDELRLKTKTNKTSIKI